MTIQYPILYGRTRDEEFTVDPCPRNSGGFSRIYRVVNRGTFFAAKLVRPKDETSASSIRHEGNILRQIQGDNIISLIYFHDGTVYDELPPYLILEWAEDTLSNMIGERYSNMVGMRYLDSKPRHFPMEQLLNMFLQICTGMSLVNETVVHCDLNPTNILSIRNTLKIADFGVSQPIGQQPSESEFREHRHWGYVAPEYWEGANSALEMDIYCAGLVFYYAATLQYPYVVSKEGDVQSAHREAHTTQVAVNPSDLNDQISSDLSNLILKMIAKKPEDRFHSWDEIITILNQCAVENQQDINPE